MKMFTRHVVKQLSAFSHGELSDAESRRVRDHLLICKRCRAEHREIKLGMNLAQQIQIGSAPSSIWDEVEALVDSQDRRPVSQSFAPGPRHAFNWYGVAAVAMVIVVAVAIGLWLTLHLGPKVSLAVQDASGTVLIGGGRIRDAGRLAVGQTLETGRSSQANITVADIGNVEVAPDTRIRLVNTESSEHRLALERGLIKATIKAPPRLFFVDTPAAEVIDLGCEYTLEVDDAGNSQLHVTLGWVALARQGREVWVPRFAMCKARYGLGPGTPYFEDANETLVDALERYDFDGGGGDDLGTVLRESRKRDTFTLWHLLPRVNDEQRVRVLDRMIELVGLPKGITREGTLRLDQTMLEAWKEELDTVWF